jgi:hypothetical protein
MHNMRRCSRSASLRKLRPCVGGGKKSGGQKLRSGGVVTGVFQSDDPVHLAHVESSVTPGPRGVGVSGGKGRQEAKQSGVPQPGISPCVGAGPVNDGSGRNVQPCVTSDAEWKEWKPSWGW